MTDLETAARAALEAMKAIVSGDYRGDVQASGMCVHRRYDYEDCGQCVDERLLPAIAALEAALAAPVVSTGISNAVDAHVDGFSTNTEGWVDIVDARGPDPAAIRRAALLEAAELIDTPDYPDDEYGYIRSRRDAAAAIRALADKEPTDG